jgi:hypothetical protein
MKYIIKKNKKILGFFKLKDEFLKFEQILKYAWLFTKTIE